MNRLIINADDFGIHTEVNQAIIDAHRNGILTSTSLLASGPAFDEAVELARSCPGLGVGIHLCMVGSLPSVLGPAEVPTLVDEQGLLPESYVGFIKNVYAHKVDFNQLYRELDAQIQKILATGLTITHIDSHQHLHVLPPVWQIVKTLMKQYHIHRLRIPREGYTFKMMEAQPVRIVGRDGLTMLARKAMTDVRHLRFTTTDYFWGMVDGGNMNERNLTYILGQIPFGVHEIMMHPGKSTAVLGGQFTWGYHWEDEYHALLSDRVKELLEQRHIALINFGDLP